MIDWHLAQTITELEIKRNIQYKLVYFHEIARTQSSPPIYIPAGTKSPTIKSLQLKKKVLMLYFGIQFG